MEQNFNEKVPLFELSENPVYKIDFLNGCQVNQLTKTERAIRRVGNHPPSYQYGMITTYLLRSPAPRYFRIWEWKGHDSEEWVPFDAPTCARLDQISMTEDTIGFLDQGIFAACPLTYQADLSFNSFTNIETADSFEIRNVPPVAAKKLSMNITFKEQLRVNQMVFEDVGVSHALASTMCSSCKYILHDPDSWIIGYVYGAFNS